MPLSFIIFMVSSKYISFLIIITLSLYKFTSCKDEMYVGENYIAFIKDTITLNKYLSENIDPQLFKYYKDNKTSKEYFVYYNLLSNSLNFIEIPDSSFSESVNLDAIKQKFTDFAIFSFDSIAFTHSTKTITILAYNKMIIYEVKGKIPYYNENYVLNSIPTLFPITVYKNNLLVYNFPTETLDSDFKLKEYFNSPRDSKLEIKDDTLKITGLYGKYPHYYQKNHNYVYSPVRSIAKDSLLIYSFDDSRKIYIYNTCNNDYQEKELATPGFQENFEFDKKQSSNFNYIAKYHIENDRFLNLIYSPFQKKYIRILSRRIKFENNDGTINSSIHDKPISLFIYDENFNLQRRIEFPPGLYNFNAFYPYREFIYILTLDKNNKMFHAFNFN
jgi:hypothetical protein